MEKIMAYVIGIILAFVLGGMLFMAIKFPNPYPGYLETPPVYSPYHSPYPA